MIHCHKIRTLSALFGSGTLVMLASASPATANLVASVAVAPAQTAPLVTLVTGQRILETTGSDGRISLTAAPSASATPLATFEANGTSYVIPAVAMHSVGTEVDPLLFDLEALRQAEATAPGEVPVQVQSNASS